MSENVLSVAASPLSLSSWRNSDSPVRGAADGVKKHNLISLNTASWRIESGRGEGRWLRRKHENPQEITEQKDNERLFLLLMTAHRYLFVIAFSVLFVDCLVVPSLSVESSSFRHISRCEYTFSHSGVSCYLIRSNYDEPERKLSFSRFPPPGSFCINQCSATFFRVGRATRFNRLIWVNLHSATCCEMKF